MTLSERSGVFLGGLGGLIAGLAAAWPIFSPPEIKTPEDLTAAIDRITDAIENRSLSIGASEVGQVESAVTSFTTQIARAAQQEDGTLPFVPRSLSGLTDYPEGQAFDFVAPNGISRLFILSIQNNIVWVTVDGASAENLTRGQNLEVEFDDQICRFELIDILEERDGSFARMRSTCVS